ncbi:S-layer homology domain-containing protein [Paenibacillus sp. UMB4589-SE434]|uniref:S-layer homology domain-containing protein n=1 Tax=Paenibacillus sp. UMB4589-SE434 TaxID=3046314 RepID=UPI00255194D1|nr:S-layer homology domain-containing protein [Paenibacillus sp. UMB4589-SE434]MDK8182848.1 S-layer homology domain-containing protein [Paenibacillus sp. UMB4589-SE434]
MKRKIAAWLSVLMLLSTFTMTSAVSATPAVQAKQNHMDVTAPIATDWVDLDKHWVRDIARQWASYGIIEGDKQGKFKPDDKVTRAEWAAMINRMFQLQGEQTQTFSDVASDAWYHQGVHTAVYNGYMQGYSNGEFGPNGALSRQEAAVSLGRLLKWENATSSVTWKDQRQVSVWAATYVAEASQLDVIKGYADGTFRPNQQLTRAEAIALLDRGAATYGEWYGEKGTYGPAEGVKTIKGNIIINAPGITLQNVHIQGKLIIGKGVGEGDVFLQNVKVDKETLVYGGGEHSIHVDNSVLVNVIVDKRDGSVRLVAKGSTVIQEVIVHSPAAIEAAQGVNVSKIKLAEQLPAHADIRLSGYFNTVEVEAYSIRIQIPKGTIRSVHVGEKGKGTVIDASKEAELVALVLDASVKVVGEALIKQATVNVSGVSFDKAPTQIKVGEQVTTDMKIIVGGKERVIGQPSGSTGRAPSGSGISGGNNTGGDTTNGGSEGTQGGNKGGNPGGNSGDGATGGNNNGGITDTGNGFVITREAEYVTVGANVYGTSTRSGVVYLIPNQVNYEKPDLIQIAIETGIGKKVDVRANEGFSIDTTGLTPNPYTLIVYDEKGFYSSYQNVKLVAGKETPFNYDTFVQVGKIPEQFGFKFNRIIKVADGVDLDASVLISTYSDPVYRPFSDIGEVIIEGTTVMMIPTKPYIDKSFSFKILAGTVTPVDTNERNELKERTDMSHLINVNITDAQFNLTLVKAGQLIPFSVDRESTVYLVLSDVSGNADVFERQVANGWGKKVLVQESQVGQTVYMDTANLSSGNYVLRATRGRSVHLKIVQ